jgi:PEP-CTERM motif
MKRYLSLGFAVAVGCASLSQAAVIQLIDPATGLDSGWQASFPDSLDVSLVVDGVTADAVFIEKFVDFDQPVGPGGVFPAVNIVFTQTGSGSSTVPNIVINDETLTNLTGSTWGGFDWLVVGDDEAWFDVNASSGFSTSPFDNQTFGDFIGGDLNRATTLRTSGGTLDNLQSFFPGAGSGQLWIGVDTGLANTTSFALKQIPVPEPATLALLVVGAAGMIRRRVRR